DRVTRTDGDRGGPPTSWAAPPRSLGPAARTRPHDEPSLVPKLCLDAHHDEGSVKRRRCHRWRDLVGNEQPAEVHRTGGVDRDGVDRAGAGEDSHDDNANTHIDAGQGTDGHGAVGADADARVADPNAGSAPACIDVRHRADTTRDVLRNARTGRADGDAPLADAVIARAVGLLERARACPTETEVLKRFWAARGRNGKIESRHLASDHPGAGQLSLGGNG